MKQKLIELYTTELNSSKQSDILNFATFNKDKIQAIESMILFLNIASSKELNKLPSIFLKFAKNNYLSSDELKFIQTRYYNLIKYNSVKNAKNNKNNKSYLFGFIEEVSKGYYIKKGDKVFKDNSIYKITKDSNDFLGRIVLLLKDYKDIIKENDDKMFIRSLKKFNNVKVQNIEPNKDYKVPFYFDEKRKKAIKYIQNINLLIQIPSKNPDGRVYNKYWNALKKEDKINLLPNYASYDINTSVYQFLFQEAKKNNLSFAKIKHYIENKKEIRKFIPKETFNHLPYKIEKGFKIQGNQYILELGKEITCILNKILDKKSLFEMYEIWETERIQDFIDKNNLTNYITNHDEVLVHNKEKVTCVPSIFGIETIQERKDIVTEYNKRTQTDFIKERDKREKEQDKLYKIIHYRSVLKRTKNLTKRLDYLYKIESLKVSYDENLLTNSLMAF